jgi:hypothetical protein
MKFWKALITIYNNYLIWHALREVNETNRGEPFKHTEEQRAYAQMVKRGRIQKVAKRLIHMGQMIAKLRLRMVRRPEQTSRLGA